MWCTQVSPEDHHLKRKAQKRWWSQQLCDTTTQVGFCTWLPHHAVAEDGLSILPHSYALSGSLSFLLQSPALAPQLHMVYLKKNRDVVSQNHGPIEGTWALWLSALNSGARESQGSRRFKERTTALNCSSTAWFTEITWAPVGHAASWGQWSCQTWDLLWAQPVVHTATVPQYGWARPLLELTFVSS